MGLYDAVPVPMMQPEDVIRYIRDRFPELIHLFGDPDDGPYYPYNRLAEEVMRRQDDRALFEAFCSLINEMAASKEYWLGEVLGDLLEGIAHYEVFTAKLFPRLNQHAQEMLRTASR